MAAKKQTQKTKMKALVFDEKTSWDLQWSLLDEPLANLTTPFEAHQETIIKWQKVISERKSAL